MSTEILYLSALILGFGGSLHCLGMCGAIALSLPNVGETNARFALGRYLYNFGRISSYAILGAIFGAFGFGYSFTGYQQALSLITGAVLLAIYILDSNGANLPLLRWFGGQIQKLFGKLYRVKPNLGTLYLFGVLNGFLPCGMVYMALAGATATGNVLGGAGYMALFGLGTLPLMLVVSLGRRLIKTPHSARAIRLVSLAMACLFILRGLNLGVPYLSPKFEPETQVVRCH